MNRDSTYSSTRGCTPLAALWLVGFAVVLPPQARSQVALESDRGRLTVEGFANFTGARADAASDPQTLDDGRLDTGLRILGSGKARHSAYACPSKEATLTFG